MKQVSGMKFGTAKLKDIAMVHILLIIKKIWTSKRLQVIQMVKQKANILVDLRLHTIVRVIHVMAQIVVAQRGQVKLFLVKLLRLTHL